MKLRPAAAGDAEAMAAAHALAFEAPWTAREIAAFLAGPGGFGLAVEDPLAEAPGALAGFILCRAVAGEAEVLTLATVPERRRRGVARALLQAAADTAAAAGAGSLFLEVAVDNVPAIALYDMAGFRHAGLRKSYYLRQGAPPADALILRRDLPR